MPSALKGALCVAPNANIAGFRKGLNWTRLKRQWQSLRRHRLLHRLNRLLRKSQQNQMRQRNKLLRMMPLIVWGKMMPGQSRTHLNLLPLL